MLSRTYGSFWRSIIRVPLKGFRASNRHFVERVQGFLDRRAFALDHIRFKTVGTISIILAAGVGYWFQRPLQYVIIALALNLIVLAWKFWGRRAAVKASTIAETPADLLQRVITDRKRLIPSGDRLQFGCDAVYNSQVNAQLEHSPLKVRFLEEHYLLPDLVVTYASQLLSGKQAMLSDTTNDPKIRLVTELLEVNIDELSEVVCQPTDYYSTLLTNESAHFNVMDDQGRSLIKGSDYWLNSHRVVPLEESGASNQIGITTLCICVHEREALVVIQLANTQQISSRVLHPSGSGSLDWDDIGEVMGSDGSGQLQKLLSHGMERELHEEVGALVGPEYCRTFITGYSRMLGRGGGKPEFFGLTITRQPATELYPAEHRVGQLFRDRVRMGASDCAGDIEARIRERSQEHASSHQLTLAAKFGAEFLARQGGTRIDQLATQIASR